MAEVQTPNRASVESKPNKKIFGTLKQPDTIIYRLIKENDVKMREDTPRFPPYIRFPNTDIINWEDGTREIRWLPGEQTIFVDEQEKNGRKIPDNILNNPNNRFEIINGDIRVRPNQKTKVQFLDLCNRNVDSQNRTGTVAAIFRRLSETKNVEQLSSKQEKQKEATDKAFGADEAQIAFHAKYLNIPMIDTNTNATRTFEAVRTDYRQKAMDDPETFLKTFDDEDLKLKYKIETAIEKNFISLNVIPGKAVYTVSKGEICDVPITTDIKQIVNTLWMYSQTKNGGDFFKKISDYEG